MTYRPTRHAGQLLMPFWLVFDQNGPVKMTKTEPSTSARERKIRIDLSVPETLFKEPQLRTAIELAGEPAVVDPQTTVVDVTKALDAIPGVIANVKIQTDEEKSDER